MEDHNIATKPDSATSATEAGASRRAHLTPWQHLTLLWMLLSAALVVLTGTRIATDGWWSLVTAWLEWPFPGLLGLFTMIAGIIIAATAWTWRDRVEGAWRWTAMLAAFVSFVVSLVLLLCALVAVVWLVFRLLAGDEEDGDFRARSSRSRVRRRRRHRARRRSRYSRW